MGRALLSAFLHDVSDTLLLLISATKAFIMKPSTYQRKLMASLQILDALVDDAEEKKFTEGGAVKNWLNELQHVVYLLEDILWQWQWQITKTKNTKSLQFFRVLSKSNMHKPDPVLKAQIHDITEKLEALVKKKDFLGLIARVTWRETLQGMPSCSVVLDNYFYGNYPKDYFYGRDEEEKSMLESLLSTSEGEHVKVINIAGKAGAGKTAFADVIYFNHKVRECFELRAWVTVPHRASLGFLTKKILEAVTEEFVPGKDFHELRKRLKESFEGKKFLLVLDDICIGDGIDEWSMLIASFEEAAVRGSAIILTSNSDGDPLFLPPANQTLHLGQLTTENSWSIFLVHAFGQMDLHEHPELGAIGKEIVNKLGNLPLAAKMIGSLLQDKVYLTEWVQILRSELLDAGDVNFRIPSFLVLCYLDLPAQLKRCLAYLSLFPKGYEFKKKEVVLLWMAQGLLQNTNSKSNDKSMEDNGDEYFGCLIMRSFLQPFGSGVSFIMHDLVHDLATYAFGESCRHHLSYSRSTHDFPESFFDEHRKLLRTILPVYLPLERAPSQFSPLVLEKVIMQLNPQVFRVLSLTHYDITNLPASIERLSHLYYLDLSYTKLQTLPDSICDLVNLQTLLLTNCNSLTTFPPRICKLINLRCLDVRDSGVEEMPLEIHKLTSLRTLTDFIVSENGQRFGDLEGLTNLKTLTISKLQNVAYAKDASSAKLKEKKSLEDLMLQWGNGDDSNTNEMEVLENLEPHRDLKRLTIEHYGGARFPHWLRDPSYWALEFLDLRHCVNCNLLPTLGSLPFLKDLFIEGFTQVSSIGHEFYGAMTASHKPFQSLVTLQFCDMLEWKEWNILDWVEFPYLIELYIIRCPKLVGNLPKQLLSLQKLEIVGCYHLVAPLPKVSNTCEVSVHDSNEILMRNVVKTHSQASLRRVTISEEVQEITPQSYSGFPSTKYTIGSSLSEVGEIADEARMETEYTRNKLPPDIASLDTRRISKLKEPSSGMVPHQVESDIPSIKQKTDPQSSMGQIADIPITTQALIAPLTATSDTTTHVKVETFSTQNLDNQRPSFEMLKVTTLSQLKLLPPNLHSLKIEGCESLEVLPHDLLNGLPTLQELYLISCSSLRSFTYPSSLKTLYARNCARLEFLPSSESRQKLSFLHHLFIGNSCDSLTTLTLDLFPELKILCMWDCPNLESFRFTGELKGHHTSLESLEIRDCPNLKSFPDEGLNAPNLASIIISNCTNLIKLPNDMNSLTSLNSLFLHKNPLIESFPFGGLPSSLAFLSISHCDKLAPQKEWGLEHVNSLTHFELEGGCIGMDSFPEEKLLPSNVNSLRISTLQSLKKLDHKGFQHLNTLQTLEIDCCHILHSLPDEGLPCSLNYVCVKECPMLSLRLKPKFGKDWYKVGHIPHIQIDDQIIS